ncbi:DUF928 domain-containing protein [Nostoc linckia FACHB-104]|nr:DUF928 domain-containing protein [Nostoc linckia FACHB-104]
MQQGYAATSRRNYRQAKEFFERAQKISPGSRSAPQAITNVTGYINRGQRKRIGIFGKPRKVGSAATRGNCFQNQKPAIPLLPPGEEAVLTTEEYPTFYFYIPQITTETQAMEFVLRDDFRDDQSITPETIRPLYRQAFRPVNQPGIISIRIPSNSAPLQIGKRYTWGFSLVCTERKRDEDLYIEGKIERFEDEDLAAQLQQTQRTLDRAVLYTMGGIWENAISTLASLRFQRPNDPEVKKYWDDLLESLSEMRKESQKLQQLEESQELGDFDLLDAANQSFLPCCSSEQAITNKTENK